MSPPRLLHWSVLSLTLAACPETERILVRAAETCLPAVYGRPCEMAARDVPCDPVLSCVEATVRWGPGEMVHLPAGVCVDDLTSLCATRCGTCPFGCATDAAARASSHMERRGAASSLLHARDLLCAEAPLPDAAVTKPPDAPDAASSDPREAGIFHPGLLNCPGGAVLHGTRCDDPTSHVDCLGLEGFSCSDGVVRRMGGGPFPTPNLCGLIDHVAACTLGCDRCARGCASDWMARHEHMHRTLGARWWRDGDARLLCAETAWTPPADAGANDAR